MKLQNIILLVTLALALLPIMAGCGGRGANGFVVKPGNVALIINHYSGKVDPKVRHAGWNAQPPFSGNEIVEIPTYIRTYTMVSDAQEGAHTGDDSVAVNTLNSNTLRVDCSISYHINFDTKHEDEIINLYTKYRTQFADNYSNFEESQLRPAFRQAINDAFGLQNTTDSMTGDGKRKAAAYALAQLNAKFNPDSIIIDDVRIRLITPDAATVETLRTRLQAQQNLRLSKLDLQLNALVNKKAVMEAQAQADAARIRAASLTPRLVKFKHLKDIEIVGVPGSTIINIPPDTASK